MSSSNLVDIFLLSLFAMLNPSLLAATTLMLLLPNPKRLMIGYLLGAYMTSITLGLLIVFTLHGSSTESTSRHTVSPAEDIVVGLLVLTIAFILRTARAVPSQWPRCGRRHRRRVRSSAAGHPGDARAARAAGRAHSSRSWIAVVRA